MAKQVYCNNCGHIGKPKGASMLVFILLFMFLAMIGGIIYLLVAKKKCRLCGSTELAPLDSPIARAQLQNIRQSTKDYR